MYWLRQRVHPTWHLTALCYGFIGGVALAMMWRPDVWIACMGAVALGICTAWIGRRIGIIIAIGAGVLFGLARGSAAQYDLTIYQPLLHKHVIISGAIADDVDAAAHGTTRMRLKDIQLDGHSLPGQMFVNATGKSGMRRSDKVTIDGVLEPGFGSFAATMKGTIKTIQRPIPGDVALEVRDGFAIRVRSAIDEPAASLGIGYLLGQKSTLPNELADALKVAGLTHIVVASGYNLTILVRLGRRLFARLSKYVAALTSGGLIVGFIAMTGLSPSMTRAGLVAGLSLWAWYYGRKFHPVTLLGLAAAVTVLVNPSYVWGDIGWLLSFAAFAGVMIVAPIMTNYFFGSDKVPFVAQVLLETIAAQITTLPIMIIAFQQFSIIAPLANLLILPLVPLIMLLVAVAGIGVLMMPATASWIGWPAEHLLNLQTKLISWCADIPWAMSKPEWQWWGALVYVAAIAATVGYMKWRTGYRLYTASIVE